MTLTSRLPSVDGGDGEVDDWVAHLPKLLGLWCVIARMKKKEQVCA